MQSAIANCAKVGNYLWETLNFYRFDEKELGFQDYLQLKNITANVNYL